MSSAADSGYAARVELRDRCLAEWARRRAVTGPWEPYRGVGSYAGWGDRNFLGGAYGGVLCDKDGYRLEAG